MIRTSLPDLRLILVEEKTHVLIEKLRVGDLDAAFWLSRWKRTDWRGGII